MKERPFVPFDTYDFPLLVYLFFQFFFSLASSYAILQIRNSFLVHNSIAFPR